MADFLAKTSRRIREGVDVEVLARVVGRDNVVLVPSDFAAGAADVYLYEINNTTALYSDLAIDATTGNPEGGAILFAALQTDGRWKADTVGYNFRYPVRHADFAAGVSLEGGNIYKVEVVFHTTSQGQIVHVWEYDCQATYTG